MAIQRAILLIADIGGYTRFMKVHRYNLSHAQNTVAMLLETILDAAKGMQLAKLEGDAAFLWMPVKNDDTFAKANQALIDIRRAFLKKQATLVVDRMCNCDSCMQIEQLTLKFVAHEGEVALQKVKQHTELAGVDVILVHRMLKNDVPLKEYALLTDELHQRLVPPLKALCVPLQHDFEGIGPTQTHYLDLTRVLDALPPSPPSRSLFRRLWEKVKFELATVPYMLGLKEPCGDFKNKEFLQALPPGEAAGDKTPQAP
jgi:hypothetical protein